jgi:hypothetical protein
MNCSDLKITNTSRSTDNTISDIVYQISLVFCRWGMAAAEIVEVELWLFAKSQGAVAPHHTVMLFVGIGLEVGNSFVAAVNEGEAGNIRVGMEEDMACEFAVDIEKGIVEDIGDKLSYHPEPNPQLSKQLPIRSSEFPQNKSKERTHLQQIGGFQFPKGRPLPE